LVLRSLLPRLTGGSAQSTLLEVVAATGDDRDREWIWRVALDRAVAPLARATGLEQVGRLRRPSELGALFREDPPQLVRYALLEQLRRHPSPEAGTMLRALLRAESPGVMRDAIRAALEARIGRP
jgi:HEAT repeat protein